MKLYATTLLLVVLLCSCKTGQAARGMRAADAAFHATGLAGRFPDTDDELHRRIAAAERGDPDAPFPWTETLAGIGSTLLLAAVGLKRAYDAPGKDERTRASKRKST